MGRVPSFWLGHWCRIGVHAQSIFPPPSPVEACAGAARALCRSCPSCSWLVGRVWLRVVALESLEEQASSGLAGGAARALRVLGALLGIWTGRGRQRPERGAG